MAKLPKPKKRELSLHSRAARRQTSPPPAPLAVKPSAREKEDQPWLYHTHNSGITKKKKTKRLTRQQRLRQQRGLENAERNEDKLSKKVLDSKRRGRKIQRRREEWEDVNGNGNGNGTLAARERDGGKENDGERNQEEHDEDAGDGEESNARTSDWNWTEKMVEVELKEAMDDIAGFELPSFGNHPGGMEEFAVADGGRKKFDVDEAVADVDEIT